VKFERFKCEGNSQSNSPVTRDFQNRAMFFKLSKGISEVFGANIILAIFESLSNKDTYCLKNEVKMIK